MGDCYLSVNFTIKPPHGLEILIAELSHLGFEMFEEKHDRLIAYIKDSDFSDKLFSKVRILNSNEFNIDYQIKQVKNKNWNEEWEKNYNEVDINENCTVRAPFHKSSKKKYDIIIKPEMSFGTGHHETTRLMIDFLFEQNLENKKICDIGCGTGILSIISEKKGAKLIEAVDIDINCYKNTLDNIKRNNCHKIKIWHSSSDVLVGNFYDVILSNITLNKLKDNFENFKNISNRKTVMILSGFYENDLAIINKMLEKLNFKMFDYKVKNNWVASSYFRM